MMQKLTQFAQWISGSYQPGDFAGLNDAANPVAERVAQALSDARLAAASDGRSPTLIDYFAAAERAGLTPQQMADLSAQDVTGFILARAHLEDCRFNYIRSHGITVRGAKLDRCRLVPMTIVELMAMDTQTTLREAEFVAG